MSEKEQNCPTREHYDRLSKSSALAKLDTKKAGEQVDSSKDKDSLKRPASSTSAKNPIEEALAFKRSNLTPKSPPVVPKRDLATTG